VVARAAWGWALLSYGVEALSDPAEVLKGLGEPTRGELKSLYRANDLTILNIVATMTAIGIYTEREDNMSTGGGYRAETAE